ncbi:MAG: hypothetical protein QOJ70_465 [Acidobacteriota bacterium]|jgi:hypothetical protein|nr:hypothetical protein [Acidobacteriota bacterium]
MKVLDNFIESLYTGEPVTVGQLKVTPVFIREEAALPFLEFEEALRRNLVEVTEVSEGGSVPNLFVNNKADRDVIIVDGELLVGAKQNRIVNTTVVVPAHTSVEIPVTCVEQGRWRYQSRNFTSGDSHSYSSLRSLKHRTVTDSLRAQGTYASDQGSIWGDIQAKMGRMSSPSPTMSMSDVYESSVSGEDEARLEEEVSAQPGQVGYFAYVRDGFAGADVFGSSELCRAKLAKLLRGHFLDSRDTYLEFPRLTVEQVIAQLRGAKPEQFASVGKGAELRFEAAGVQGACKLVDETIPHLAVFPKLN